MSKNSGYHGYDAGSWFSGFDSASPSARDGGGASDYWDGDDDDLVRGTARSECFDTVLVFGWERVCCQLKGGHSGPHERRGVNARCSDDSYDLPPAPMSHRPINPDPRHKKRFKVTWQNDDGDSSGIAGWYERTVCAKGE